VDGLWNEFSMCDSITEQLVGYDLPRFTLAISFQVFEETLCCNPITPSLQIIIDCVAVLFNCPPQIVLLAIDPSGPAHRQKLHGIRRCHRRIASVFALQSAGKNRTKLFALERDYFAANDDASPG